jgi:hypothetical protein
MGISQCDLTKFEDFCVDYTDYKLCLADEGIVEFDEISSGFYSATYLRKWAERSAPAYLQQSNNLTVAATFASTSENVTYIYNSYDQFLANKESLQSHPLSYLSRLERYYKRQAYGLYHNSWMLNRKCVTAIASDRLKNISNVIQGQVFVLSWHQDHGNYWHFIFDVAFRLFVVQELINDIHLFDFDFVVVGNDLSAFQKEIFEALLRRSLDYQVFPRGCTANSCWMVPITNASLLNSDLLNRYANNLLSGLAMSAIDFTGNKSNRFNSSSISGNRRIYIPRGKARNGRKMINEQDVITLLEMFNFSIIDPGLLSVREQSMVFNGADLIVGPHGSAFANILFMSKGAVIELVHGSYDPFHDYLLARSKGIEFIRIRSGPAFSTCIPSHQDFCCDLSRLRRALELFC